MGKRPHVPAALHDEISEYSALLRALRNKDTLDLTTQLIRAQTASVPTEEDLSDDDDLDFMNGSQSSSASEVIVAESPPPGASLRWKRKAATTKRARDHWTRWPLMVGDVHIPEWPLEEEIKTIAVQAIRRSLSGPDANPEDAKLLEDLDDDFANTLLPPARVAILADEAVRHLTRILALVAAHKPPAADSMQNRFAPYSWELVLAVMSSSGLVDVNVMQNVQRRMEAIYGPTQSVAVHRAQYAVSSNIGLQTAMARHEFSFLDVGYKRPPPPKRKRGPYKKRKPNTQATENVDTSQSVVPKPTSSTAPVHQNV